MVYLNKKKKISTDTMHNFFFIWCPNYHFNSTWTSDLYYENQHEGGKKIAFFSGHEVLYVFRNGMQLSASANLPFFHAAQLHFLQFPCVGASSHVTCKASPGWLFWHARLDSHHISKMMLFSQFGCTLLMQSREKQCMTMYHEGNGNALCSLVFE